MDDDPLPSQRDMFRRLFREHGGDQEAVIAAYAAAEKAGKVDRRSRISEATPEEYARQIWWSARGQGGWHA